MGFLLFLGVALYFGFKYWKEFAKFIIIGVLLIFAYIVVTLKDAYDYVTEPTNTEQVVTPKPVKDVITTKVDSVYLVI
jgi:hypothetical protein